MNRRSALLGLGALAFTFGGAGLSHAGDPSGAPQVRDAWARATPPGSGVAAAYLTIIGGSRDDRLVSASTAVAGMTMIHAVTETDGQSRMREADGVPVPAGRKVVFAPRGLHLMLMKLAKPLAAGDRFDVELVFEHAGKVTVPVSVIAPDQAPHAH